MNLLFRQCLPNALKHERYLHNLSKGDHVVRWDRIVVYPIQVHGIVLSASDDVVTIVDFGLTATPAKQEGEEVGQVNKVGKTLNAVDENADGNESSLDDMINHEDRAMIKTCESHRHEIMGPDRINILVLTEEKEIKKWKKVNYTVEKKKKGKFQWWWDNDDDDDKNIINNNGTKNNNEGDGNGNDNDNDQSNGDSNHIEETKEKEAIRENNDDDDVDKENSEKESNDTIRENCSYGCSDSNVDDEVATSASSAALSSKEEKEKSEKIQKEKRHKSNTHEHSITQAKTGENCPTRTDQINENNDKEFPEPLLTRSDPATIVLARVRYLVSNPHVLPPHHIFYSNSECIAVWCKTGVWSTLQASIYLHSTAAGNFKSAVTAAAAVGGSTVTTTVPAAGIGGWFGMTTTTTVSLVSVQPWLIPALAGYGIIAVGGPFIVLRKCHEQWRRATIELNDKFWSELDADVYVEAIKSWSGLNM